MPTRNRRLRRLLTAAAAAAVTATTSAQPTLTNATEESAFAARHQPDTTTLGPQNAFMQAGLAVGDFNNDGYPDIFVPVGGLAPDELYINNGDGTFTEQAADWGIDFKQGSVGAAVADINGDGWQDIYVTCYGPAGEPGQVGHHRLYRNNGDGTFTDIAVSAGVNQTTDKVADGYGAAFGDYNLDGHLDLFVAARRDHPTYNDGTGNRLFRNNGDETFTDVTDEAFEPQAMEDVWGFQPAFVDMNGNGLPDLLIAADYGTSRYLINNGDGTFTDWTEQSGTGLDTNGMGMAVGDVNNNGLLDWYVTSIYDDATQAGIVNGNALYLNQGDHSFDENAQNAGVDDGAWGWGALAVDLENNGRLDLLEVNGWGGPFENVHGRLFHNQGDGTFQNIAVEAGFDHNGQGRAMARLDADRDGRVDVLVGTYNDDAQFYRNDTPDAGHWIALTFETAGNPWIAPDGIGTHVTATVGETSYVRYLSGSPSYLSTSQLAVHIGLGDADVIDELTIRWPRGYTTTMTDVPADQYMEIDAPNIADLTGDGAVGGADLGVLLSNWGPCESELNCLADLSGDGTVGGADLGILLSNWSM